MQSIYNAIYYGINFRMFKKSTNIISGVFALQQK